MSYGELGLRPVVNGLGPVTRLGGLPMSDTVLDAMRWAVATNVRMDELQEAAGIELARLLNVPAAHVTSGAYAGLTLAAAVCAVGGDSRGVDELPLVGERSRVVIQMAHRDPYDHAVTSVGLRVTEIGYPYSTRAHELARELDGTVAAVLHRIGGEKGDMLPLRTVAELSHAAGVPVIVDAADSVPPLARLRAMYDDGADLIAISGGKAFRGPQASGILCGKPDLIRHVALHHLDMDLRDATWNASDITGYWPTGGREGIGRGMKVGREQIIGLLTAVTEFASDPGRWTQQYLAELAACDRALAGCETLSVSAAHDSVMDVPTLVIDFSEAAMAADDVSRLLDRGTPRIQLSEAEAWRNRLILNPMALARGDGAQIGKQILAVLEAGLDDK
jgi:D-glucosaminate-6-phosphate ammonia-lyase